MSLGSRELWGQGSGSLPGLPALAAPPPPPPLLRVGLVLALWPCASIHAGETAPHWSLRPLSGSAQDGGASMGVPVGASIDDFVDQKLREHGLSRSPEADRRTLLRRLTHDLTGLPPTPEETASFVTDNDPLAYEKLTDRLLGSPRYGERWARHWLDIAQYADTHGNDHDYVRPNAWPYRDYVIQSLNEDKPYARFVKEQVAGDALFPDEPEATVALGFLAAGPWDDTLMVTVREDTVDHRMGQNLDRDNMVSQVMSVFQSLTVHCARCHDHKFDPITQRQYYALQAVFAGVDRADRPVDLDPRIHRRRQGLLARRRAIATREAGLLASLEAPEVLEKVRAASSDLARRSASWQPLDVVSVASASSAGSTIFARQEDGSWLVSGARPEKDSFVIKARTRLRGMRALRLEALPDASLPHGGPGRYDNGNFHLAGFRATACPEGPSAVGGATSLSFVRALTDHSDGGDVIANALDGNPDTYWSIHPRYGEPHEAVFELEEPAGTEGGTTLAISLDFTGKGGHQIGRFRLWASTASPPILVLEPYPPSVARLLQIPEDARTLDQRRELALWVLQAEVDHELSVLPAPQPVYAATNDFAPQGSFKPPAGPRPIYLLARGDLEKPTEPVGPGAIACIPGLSPTLEVPRPQDEAARRAALARWLTDERNGLTWRSIVNRVWQHHFDRGLCDTPNDFGKMGGAPSHPELLDALAIWLRDEARGSLKRLHRRIVTSATYRQASAQREDAEGIDADNRLLWRMPRRRLTGEEVRDAALQVAGQLDLTMGGPPAIQFLARGDATFMPGGAPPFVDYEGFDPDEPASRRRAIYRFVFRTVPDPLMDALDCPDGAASTPVRSVSATALQALAMLNDGLLIRQGEHLAERIARDAPGAEAQVAAAFRLVLLREPDEGERARFAEHVRRHGLANACHVLLNTSELLYLD